MEKIGAGKAPRIPQDDSKSCYAHMLQKSMGELDFEQPAEVLERLVRGLNPWPSAYTQLQGKNLKIYEADIVEISENQQREPGMITAVDKKSFTIQCNPGGLRVTQLQLEGKKRMNTDAFLLGFAVEEGMRCGKQTQE